MKKLNEGRRMKNRNMDKNELKKIKEKVWEWRKNIEKKWTMESERKDGRLKWINCREEGRKRERRLKKRKK